MSTCNNTCQNATTCSGSNNGFVFVLVIYILLAIILGTYCII